MTSDSIPQPTEADERRFLGHVTDRIQDEAMRFDSIVSRKRGEARAIKTYINENKGDMDHAEKIATRSSADQATMLTDHAEGRREILEKLCNSPCFGRIDFAVRGASGRKPYYIGRRGHRPQHRLRQLPHVDSRVTIPSVGAAPERYRSLMARGMA